jgi:hypothetical protein
LKAEQRNCPTKQEQNKLWSRVPKGGPIPRLTGRLTVGRKNSNNSSAREFAADAHLMKFQHLQNKVLRIIGKFPRSTLIRDMHMHFQILYVNDYITKLCRQQAQVIQNHENIHVRNIGQGEARLKLGGVQAFDCSSD